MNVDLEILWENDRFVAVNKPAGLLSIPGKNPREQSVLKLLSRIYPKRSHIPVHRIDRGTSGVLLIARDEEAHREANRWFARHLMKKEYLTLAEGAPRLPAFRVSQPIEEKPALSQVQVLSRYSRENESAFLARVRIATGRRHQIRIHLANEGFPILGDIRYGGKKKFLGISFERFALHAERLTLPSESEKFGVSKTEREILAPRPEDFTSWIQQLEAES